MVQRGGGDQHHVPVTEPPHQDGGVAGIKRQGDLAAGQRGCVEISQRDRGPQPIPVEASEDSEQGMSVVARIKDDGLLVGVISGDEIADPPRQQAGTLRAQQPVPGFGVDRIAQPDHQASASGNKPGQPGYFEPVESRDIAEDDTVVSIEVLAHEAAFGDHGGCDSR